MPSDKIQSTLAWLDAHEIQYEVYYHPPLFTIEEALAYWKEIDSTHCKNLFMRNHKGNRHYLISFECHKDLDIHSLEQMIHQGKLSFASPERMDRCLGVAPGSVCAFGLINDMDIAQTANPKELFENGHRVKYFLDSDLRRAEKISFHPCDNRASVVLSNEMFMKFLAIWGGEYEWINLVFDKSQSTLEDLSRE
ncbi:MAG: prolyl-tRNA synthetase associated domain-containing protein [Candidatus Coprenecus sp.]|nr:prolyl-tRNA synthetase associated domain-containing protein [Candidatus Coprenecus sp.]